MIYEILLIKLKLYTRFEYDYKFKHLIKINYLLILLPAYLFLLHNIYIFNNFFYALSAYFLIIIGLDFHTVSNKSNLSTSFIFNYLLDPYKSIKINFFAESILKFLLLIPFLFLIKNKLFLILIGLCFISFSIFLKEIICNNTISKKIYFVLIFIYLSPLILLGGPFLDFTKKQLQHIEFTKVHFYEIYLISAMVTFMLATISFYVYLRTYYKTPSQ